MPANMELKARLTMDDLIDHIVSAGKIARESEVIEQKDTFFGTNGKEGIFLKLRCEENWETKETKNVLIAYSRPNDSEAKKSEYVITPVADVKTMIEALKMSVGVLGEVSKTRHVFIVEKDGLTARVHLDSVRGLGDFIEFEVIINEDGQEELAKEVVAYLSSYFRIEKDMLLAGPYFHQKPKPDQEKSD